MELYEYLFRKRMKCPEFGEKIGLTGQTIRAVVNGRSPSFQTAKKIVLATNHKVGFKELMKEQYEAFIEEYLRTNK